MAKQTINVGSTANDGTGDKLRDAFVKVNANFTELYSDDAGDVNSVNAGTGISVDQTTGAVTVTNSAPNATHTGEVTGSGALTIANGVIDYDKLYKGYTDLNTQTTLVWNNTGDECAIIDVTLTGDTTFSVLGIKQAETKIARISGNHTLSFGGDSNTYKIITGAYDGTTENFLQFFAVGNYPTQTFYITISQEV